MPTKSIYLDEATDALANELLESTGQSLSVMFREFLLKWRAAQGNISHLAFIQDMSGSPLSAREDPYGFDRWIEVENTRSVFLMGLNLRQGLIKYQDLWKTLLSKGVDINIVRQGGLDDPKSEVAGVLARLRGYKGTVEATKEELLRLRLETDEALRNLKRVANKGEGGTLEVRDYPELMTFSGAMISKKNPVGALDLQIHPYVPNYAFTPGPRFIVSVNESSRIAAALIQPMAQVWSSAEPVKEFATSLKKVSSPILG